MSKATKDRKDRQRLLDRLDKLADADGKVAMKDVIKNNGSKTRAGDAIAVFRSGRFHHSTFFCCLRLKREARRLRISLRGIPRRDASLVER